MSEHHEEENKGESLMDKIADKIHGHDSSSDADDHKPSAGSLKNKVWRLFGRESDVHKCLGGGKPADIFMWRDKKASGAVIGGITAIYVLFKLLEYSLLTLICHVAILALAASFLWSNASHFIKKSPPNIPKVHIPEEVAEFVRFEVNHGLTLLRDIALGKDLKKFLGVIAGLWVLSVLGSCFSFVSLFYITFVLLFTVPVFYEKYEDKVDSYAEKATPATTVIEEIKKNQIELINLKEELLRIKTIIITEEKLIQIFRKELSTQESRCKNEFEKIQRQVSQIKINNNSGKSSGLDFSDFQMPPGF